MAKAKNRWSEPKGDLHKLLTQAFPERRTASYDVLDIGWLAAKLEMSEEGIYKWLREDTLPTKRARQIVKIKGCRKTFDDFLPHIA